MCDDFYMSESLYSPEERKGMIEGAFYQMRDTLRRVSSRQYADLNKRVDWRTERGMQDYEILAPRLLVADLRSALGNLKSWLPSVTDKARQEEGERLLTEAQIYLANHSVVTEMKRNAVRFISPNKTFSPEMMKTIADKNRLRILTPQEFYKFELDNGEITEEAYRKLEHKGFPLERKNIIPAIDDYDWTPIAKEKGEF